MKTKHSGLHLEQDAAITYGDFVEIVIPHVQKALGDGYVLSPSKKHPIHIGGGICVKQHPKHVIKGNEMSIRFEWTCEWPRVEDPSPDHVLMPPSHSSIHKISYVGTLEARWKIDEIDTVNCALVQILQWKVWQSKGMKLAKTFYVAPVGYNYKSQVPLKFWKSRHRLQRGTLGRFMKTPRRLKMAVTMD